MFVMEVMTFDQFIAMVLGFETTKKVLKSEISSRNLEESEAQPLAPDRLREILGQSRFLGLAGVGGMG